MIEFNKQVNSPPMNIPLKEYKNENRQGVIYYSCCNAVSHLFVSVISTPKAQRHAFGLYLHHCLLINSQLNATQLNRVKSDNDYWSVPPTHTVQSNEIQCNEIQCNEIQCNEIQCNEIQCNEIQCNEK